MEKMAHVHKLIVVKTIDCFASCKVDSIWSRNRHRASTPCYTFNFTPSSYIVKLNIASRTADSIKLSAVLPHNSVIMNVFCLLLQFSDFVMDKQYFIK